MAARQVRRGGTSAIDICTRRNLDPAASEFHKDGSYPVNEGLSNDDLIARYEAMMVVPFPIWSNIADLAVATEAGEIEAGAPPAANESPNTTDS